MIKIEIDTEGLTDAFTRFTEQADTEVAKAVFLAGAELLAAVSRKADTGYHKRGEPHIPGTGPGPNRASGDYVRSIELITGYEGGNPVAVVATKAPQARRLEYGFMPPNIDSKGRGFNQPPYPHWRPAMEEIRPKFHQAVMDALGVAVRDSR